MSLKSVSNSGPVRSLDRSRFHSRTENRQASISHTVVLFSAYEKVFTQSPNRTLSPRVRKILSATGRRARADKILFGCVECRRKGNAFSRFRKTIMVYDAIIMVFNDFGLKPKRLLINIL